MTDDRHQSTRGLECSNSTLLQRVEAGVELNQVQNKRIEQTQQKTATDENLVNFFSLSHGKLKAIFLLSMMTIYAKSSSYRREKGYACTVQS